MRIVLTVIWAGVSAVAWARAKSSVVRPIKGIGSALDLLSTLERAFETAVALPHRFLRFGGSRKIRRADRPRARLRGSPPLRRVTSRIAIEVTMPGQGGRKPKANPAHILVSYQRPLRSSGKDERWLSVSSVPQGSDESGLKVDFQQYLGRRRHR